MKKRTRGKVVRIHNDLFREIEKEYKMLKSNTKEPVYFSDASRVIAKKLKKMEFKF